MKLEPSRWLAAWWLALHALAGLALLMANPLAALAAAPVLAAHARWRYPPTARLLLICGGGRFALPAAGRFDLALAPATRCGRSWIELVFSDLPAAPLLVLRDQLDGPGWRRLRLAVTEFA